MEANEKITHSWQHPTALEPSGTTIDAAVPHGEQSETAQNYPIKVMQSTALLMHQTFPCRHLRKTVPPIRHFQMLVQVHIDCSVIVGYVGSQHADTLGNFQKFWADTCQILAAGLCQTTQLIMSPRSQPTCWHFLLDKKIANLCNKSHFSGITWCKKVVKGVSYILIYI